MSPSSTTDGATVVITHRVRSDRQDAYERWLEEIAPLCKAATGNLGWRSRCLSWWCPRFAWPECRETWR
jgi:antibiotic biosynthesis monooxygenase (ABM) superfamily enzyme